jgi:F420-dependent oxidoreductase-like protein
VVDYRIFTEPQQGSTYAQLSRLAKATEDAGYDAFFRSDHFLHMGRVDPGPGPTEAWTTLAGLALETSRIRLGTLVTSATFRLPGPLAITVAQVDEMSGGRVELGIGAGWYEAEHTGYGIPFPPLGERFDRLTEQLAIITGLWETPPGESFSYAGKIYQITDSPALPKPAQRPRPPVIIGGGGARRTPALAARYAAEFNLAFRSADAVREQFERVRGACADIGRDPASMVWSTALTVCCGKDQAEADRRADNIGRSMAELRRTSVAGTPPECVDKLRRYAEAGVQRFYLQVLDLDDIDHIELIASDVVPPLR